MVQNADALIALWDGHSKGTAHAIKLARQYKLAVYVHMVDEVVTPPAPAPKAAPAPKEKPQRKARAVVSEEVDLFGGADANLFG